MSWAFGGKEKLMANLGMTKILFLQLMNQYNRRIKL